MQAFEYNSNSPRVIFGSGSIQKLPSEVKDWTTALIVTTPGRAHLAETLKTLLSPTLPNILVFSEAKMHTPVPITLKALAHLEQHGAKVDGVISIGGGSAIGLGKAVAFRKGLRHVCVPTTYSGSEMTAVLGETEGGRKTTRTDSGILPAVVVYDVELTLGLPGGVSAASGVNAIAHAVEALYAQNTNPITTLLALEAIKTLSTSLPQILTDPSSLPARSSALYGAWLGAMCLAQTGTALHHKLCHVLGGAFALPHAETHAVVLPHALAYNAPAIPEVMERLAGVLPGSGGDAVRGLDLLLKRLEVKRGLGELGMREGDVGSAAEMLVAGSFWNPRVVERGLIGEVVRRCWAGEEARADL